MPRLSMVPVLLREWLGTRSFPREPEPDLVMDGIDQVAAYEQAGRIDGVMAAAYVFHTARITSVIQSCRSVLDMGCGPGVQLAQIASLNPQVQFLGVDLSGAMLDRANALIKERSMENVRVQREDITALAGVPDQSVDGVVSTMALHHLPSLDHLERCFTQIRRVLRPGGALYLTDFSRLKYLRSVIYFAYQNAKHQPHLFSLDYERSLRAAFLAEEFAQTLADKLPGRAKLYATFKVPFLVIIKSEDRELSPSLINQLKKLRGDLPGRYRRELDDIRTFFALGGLPNDPFRR